MSKIDCKNMRFHDRVLQITIKYLYSEHEIGDYFPDTSQENIGHHRRGISKKQWLSLSAHCVN